MRSLAAPLTNVTIPASVGYIDDYAFSPCANLVSVTISNGVPNIGNYTFSGCPLTNITIPGSVISIGDGAFSNCTDLASITLSNGVVGIGNYTFSGCPLTTITIPASVTNIGSYAFAGCTNLTAVYFTGNAPTIGTNVFFGDNNATIYYLPGANGWSSTFGGRPAVLQNTTPLLIQTGDGSFGARSNRFGFNITGTADIPIVVEACTNLASPVWSPLLTATLTNGLFYFSEPFQANAAGRFYRVSSP